MTDRSSWRRIASGVAIVFGFLTVFSGATTLFGAVDMGAVVPFVLWFNTVAGLAYVIAGAGLWLGLRWAFPLSVAIVAATLLVLAGFGLHVARGGAFEMRTVFAMALRGTVWGGDCPCRMEEQGADVIPDMAGPYCAAGHAVVAGRGAFRVPPSCSVVPALGGTVI